MSSIPPADTAAIYARISRPAKIDPGRRGDSRLEDGGRETSIDTQATAARAYCAERGYRVAEQHVRSEVHTAAHLYERDVLCALWDAARRREFTVLVCYAVDRLTREQAHMYLLTEDLARHGVRVEFVTEKFEDTAMGKFLLSARTFASELEREAIRERTMRGKRARVWSGLPIPTNHTPYGYRWSADRTTLEEDPTTAAVVRRLFQEAAAGVPLQRIAAALSDRGVPSPTGRDRWRPNSIRYLLRKTTYVGRAPAWRGEREIAVPPLVEPSLFVAAGHRLTRNRDLAARNNRNPGASLLRGYVRCSCGAAATVNNRPGRVTDYQCGRHSDDSARCRRPRVHAADLDAAVVRRIGRLLHEPERIAAELDRMRANDPTTTDLAAVDHRLETIARQQKNLAAQLGNVEGEAAGLLVAQINRLEKERTAIVAERDVLLFRRRGWEHATARLEELEEWCRTVAARWATADAEHRRLAFEAFGLRVTINPAVAPERWTIELSIPLEDEPIAVSGSGSAPQNRVVFRWSDHDAADEAAGA